MIVKGRINGWASEWKGLTDDQYAALRVALEWLPEDRSKSEHALYEQHYLGPRELAACAAAGLTLTFEAADSAMLVRLQEAGRSGDSSRPADLLDGRVVQIAIPDLGLLTIDEVTNLDDCCTDELQRHLREGWRLLAVCPPNAQRRPDYILGRRRRSE